jgi:hypothetical protein
MRASGWLFGVGLAVAVSAAGVTAVGCASAPPKFGNIKTGEMPAGESWVGVYYNPVYGYLHMVEQDGNVVGRWKRTDSSHWGELTGTVDGNVMHFTWKEHQYGAIGPNSDVKGEGVFAYKTAEAAPELDGQYSIEGSDSVGAWHCVKQLNTKPDLNSINGDNPSEGPAVGDKWQ